MLPEAAKLAIKVAMATSPVAAVCCPVDYPKTKIEIERAAIGAVSTTVEGTNGQLVRINIADARSLIIWPADLMIGQNSYQPVQGDLWQITLPSGETIDAECTPFPPEPCWRWTDRFQTAHRIHLKVRDAESV